MTGSLVGRKAAYAWTAPAVLGVMVFDLMLPLGVAGGIPYVLAIMVAAYTSDKRFIIGVTVLASFLVVLGLLLSPEGGEIWKILVNRALAIAVIVGTGLFLIAFHRLGMSLAEELRVQKTLTRVGQVVSHSANLQEQFKNVSAMLNEIVGHDRLVIASLCEDGETLVDNYVAGEHVGGDTSVPVPISGDSGLADLILHGIPILRNGAQTRNVSQTSVSEKDRLRSGLKSLIAVPLVCQSKVIGILNFRSKNENAYGPVELSLAIRISDLLSGAVANANLASEIGLEQNRLAEAKSTYRDLYDNAPDMYVSVDAATGIVVKCNKTVCDALGYSREEILGSPITNIYHPDSRRAFWRDFHRLARTGTILDAELRLQRKDGSVLDVVLNASAVKDDKGNVIRSRGIMRDVTAHKKAEEELRVRVAALEAAAEMVVITDSQGIIQYVNRAFVRETGYELEEVIGANLRVLKSGRQDPEFYRDLWDTITVGNVWRGTLINRRKNGSEYPEEMTVTPVAGEDGAVNHFIAIKRNISERLCVTAEREAARDLEAENRDLVRLNEARSEFLSSVSHELRTPLTALLAFGDILSRNRDDTMTPRQLEQLNLIRNNGWKLNELINDLLDVSRSEAGTFKIEKQDFDLIGMLREVTASADSIFEQKHQNLSVEVGAGPVWVGGDEKRITQVINNLLTNASKYSPDQSEIGIRLSDAVGGINIDVIDQGIGISKVDIARLFTPFFRVDNEQTRQEGGTGLGLVIAKTITELHDGNISVESTPGVGTTMRVFLPTISSNLLAVEGSVNSQYPTPEKAAS